MKIYNCHIKNRTIIAIIITLIVILLTNQIWLVFKPLPVDIDIKGKGNIKVEVQLNKKDNNDYNKIKNAVKQINLDDKSHIEVLVDRAKYPKRIRIILSKLIKKQPITISNIQFRNGKWTIKNLEKFKIVGATSNIQDNKIILIPSRSTVSITYPDTLTVRCSIRFQFELFIIILILTYLLAYKLTDYIAEFKTTQGKSRIDIVFLVIFFVFLFIPMSHISHDDKSMQENRMLAEWKPLIAKSGEINYNFGKDFNNWFNDRFYLRKFLVHTYNNIKYNIDANRYINKKGRYLNKKTGQMYFGKSENHKNLTNSEIKLYSKNLNRFNEYCKKNNIRLYIFIAPSVDSYYRNENLLFYPLKEDQTIPLIKYAKEKYNLDIIYPENELREKCKRDSAYFKTDHHFTDSASYIVYKLLINKIKKDFPQINLTSEDKFKIYKRTLVRKNYTRKFDNGCEYNSLGIDSPKLLETEYYYYDYKHSDRIDIKELEYIGAYRHFNPNGHFKLMIIGDSMHENIVYFLNTSFKEIYKYRTNIRKNKMGKNEFDMKFWYKKIEEIKPDIIIINQRSGSYNFSKMYKEVK